MPPRVPWRAVTLDATGTLLRPREPVSDTYARFLAQTITLDSSQRTLVAAHVARSFPLTFERLSAASGNFGRAETPDARSAAGWWEKLVLESLPTSLVEQLRAADAAERFAGDVYAHFATGAAWHVFDDVRPALDTLRSADVPLGVISNFDERLGGVLREVGLREYFAVVTTSWDVGVCKPHAAIFTSTFATLTGRNADAAFDDVVHVGDHRVRDYDGARAAGAQARWLQRRPADRHGVHPQHILSRLDELVAPLWRSGH